MLKWIVGAKVDHPLADAKQSRAAVSGLPADSVRALDQITRWLQPLKETEGLKADRLFEIVDLVDTAAKTHQRKLFSDYLGMSRQQKLQEHKVWTCGFNFSKELADAYHLCVTRCDESSAGAVRKQLAVIVARALRALAFQMKWTMLRYGPFEPRLWSSIGALYVHAEKAGFVDTTVAIYSGSGGNGTVRQEYLKALMLWASRADVLPPAKQEIVERVIAQYADTYRLAPEPFAGAIYYFDPAQDRPPSRVLLTSPIAGGVHFFGPGEAQAKVARLIGVLGKDEPLPAALNFGRNQPPDVVLSVLRHLALHWSANPPTRIAERRPATARITVVPGYTQLLGEFEREESDALNFSGRAAESWVVENASENGYGALVPAAATDWIRAGELIGVQVEGSAAWAAGLVRRVARDEKRQYHVGIEVISRSVDMVNISAGAGRESEHAMLLSREPDANGEVPVVMRAARFDAANSLRMELHDASYLLMPSRLIETGEDFDRAMYRMLREET